jgi:hypothetical protein
MQLILLAGLTAALLAWLMQLASGCECLCMTANTATAAAVPQHQELHS